MFMKKDSILPGMKRLHYTLLFTLFLGLPLMALSMSTTNVQPANLVQTNRTTVTLTFTIAATLPANGKVKAIFPAGLEKMFHIDQVHAS